MTWVRVDDGALHHEKLLEAGPDAVCLWLAGLCYANRHTTDGALARGTLLALYPSEQLPPARAKRAAARLVEVNLWEISDAGWVIRNYERYQAEAMSSTRDRRREADKAAKATKRSARNPADPAPVRTVSESDTPPIRIRTAADPQDVGAVSAPPVPSRPDPARPDPDRERSSTATDLDLVARATPAPGGRESPPPTSIREADRVRDPQLADVAWTSAVGARGGSFVAHPTRDAPTFRAIAALVARTSPGRPLAEALRASADAHLAQRTSGRSSPEYWLEWLQREASGGSAPQSGVSAPEAFRPIDTTHLRRTAP